MCVTYPAQVVELTDTTAIVSSDQRTWRASTILVPETRVGDWVIVAAGTILQVIDPDEAREIQAMLDEALRDAPASQELIGDEEQEAIRR